MANLEILGVHPVAAEEPCFLVEARVTDSDGPFEVEAISQPDASLPRANWQVPYAEKLLNLDGSGVLADPAPTDGDPEVWVGEVRLAFFMHYLNFETNLLTPFGEVPLPAPTRTPVRLRTIEYEAP